MYKCRDSCYNDYVQLNNTNNIIMLTRVEEMIDDLHSRTNATAGFTAKEVYEVGREYGLTCREIGQNFLGKAKCIGYSRYLPQNLPLEVITAALTAGPTKRGRKPGAAKKATAKKLAKAIEPEVEDEIAEDFEAVEAPESSDDGCCFIASPEEIAEDFEVEAPPKRKAPPKQRKVKVS